MSCAISNAAEPSVVHSKTTVGVSGDPSSRIPLSRSVQSETISLSIGNQGLDESEGGSG